MVITSAPIEIQAIKTICQPSIGPLLYAMVDLSYFQFDPAREAYSRIVALVKSTGHIPNLGILCEDPAISYETRQVLINDKTQAVTNKHECYALFEMLNNYRRLRILTVASRFVLEQVRNPKVNVDQLVNYFSETASQLYSTVPDVNIIHFGENNNSQDIVKHILESKGPPIIPTGFETFDKRNGGFILGSLVTIGATTGGGKCLTGDTLVLTNKGYKTIEYLYHYSSKKGMDKWSLFPKIVELTICDRPVFSVGIYQTRGETIKIVTDKGSITGLPEHKLWNYQNFIELKDITVGMELWHESGKAVVLSVEPAGDQIVYDLNVPFFNCYIANGFLSHNSAMANQLLINMATLGYKVCLVPLEMTTEEVVCRIMANISGINVLKYIQRKLSRNEKQKVLKDYEEWISKVASLGGRYSIYEPPGDVSIEDLLLLLKPYNYEVIIVDYVSLLKGVDSEDQWRKLGAIARYAKVFATNHNMIIILLVQVGADGLVRYSKALTEHSNNCWVWVYTDKNRESGIIDIRQLKARNQEAFPFQLHHDFATMRIRDITTSNLNQITESGIKKRKKFDSFIASIQTYLDDMGDSPYDN